MALFYARLFKGNGFIPTSSLREILAALDDQLTSDQLNGKLNAFKHLSLYLTAFFVEMIAEIDTDSSGTVDFDGECFN